MERIDKLTPATPAQWGKMNVAQMLAHCHLGIESALGRHNIPRLFIGRIIAPFIRASVLGEKPFQKNSPTDKSYKFPADVDFAAQKAKLKTSLQEFLEGGEAKCTRYPHPFFGRFSPAEWAVFQWKHIDHHLRQFGV